MYKFRSQAAADLIMLAPTGDRVLALLGREPASKGIIEVASMAQAIERLSAAVSADEATRQQASTEEEGGEAHRPVEVVSLRQRVWPLVQMLRTCQAADQPIVWGV